LVGVGRVRIGHGGVILREVVRFGTVEIFRFGPDERGYRLAWGVYGGLGWMHRRWRSKAAAV
jgi:hypothetical protein